MTTPVQPLWWEEIEQGQSFALGSKQITRDEIIRFASEFDPQPFHVDEEAARSNPMFGRLCASGVHLFAITSRLIFDGFMQHGIHPLGGCGVEKMRFLNPVFPDDMLHLTLTIMSTRPLKSRADRGLVEIESRLTNQHGTDVLSKLGIFFMQRRPA